LVGKTQYDGMGRPVKTFISDGGGDSGWTDADDVTGDYVLEQTESAYDIFSNPTLVTQKARFHDESATGALGSASQSPYARVSYLAAYFDAADRVTDLVNVGTNGGTAYTRPSSAPARSDTTLVTSYGYKADEVQTVALTGSPTTGTFKLTFTVGTTSEDSAPIAALASASDVDTALEGISLIGANNIAVTGLNGGPWTVRFVRNQGEMNVKQLTGTNINLGGGSGTYTVPTTTPSEGGDAGRVQKVTDPRGLLAKTDYDLMDRVVRTVENYVNFLPAEVDDKTTEFAYDGMDHLTLLTAVLPNNAFQKTEYVYGVEPSLGSDLNSNDLLRLVKYPDKSSGAPSTATADQESYKYNLLGDAKEFLDRNGTTHAYSYDVVGRLTKDAATLGSGSTVDGAILRQEVAYDTAGRAFQFTSYNAASGGSVVNQVQQAFNGLGQLITEYQSHAGTVDTGTTPRVQYAYTEMASGANHSRLKNMTYPNGRLVRYEYTTGTGYTGLDDRISRLSFLADGTTTSLGQTLEQFSYLGLALPIRRARPQPDMDLTYLKRTAENPADAGDQYTGLDRFGRVVDQRWRKGNTGLHADRFMYGYDRNSNRLYRDNAIGGQDAFDELYHANGATQGYDGFNQLKEFRRGPLSDSTPTDGVPDTVTTASRLQSWTHDVMGNWDDVTSGSTGGGTTTDDRGHNKQNQITSGAPSASYDSAGNTTQFTDGGVARKYVYDAWNRLVRVTNTAGTTTHVAYAHDALGRRVCVVTGAPAANPCQTTGGITTDLYYSDSWQVLEENVGTTTKAQYVWSPVYVDAMVLRDRDANGTPGDGPYGSNLEQRLYVQHDANFNVTALVDTSGNAVERYVYDPYGAVTKLKGDWTSPPTTDYAWVYLHQGGRYDDNAKLYHFRMRELSPTLGRWMQNDPLGYVAGDSNLYRFVTNNPISRHDPLGLYSTADFIDCVSDCLGIPINVAVNLIAAVTTAEKLKNPQMMKEALKALESGQIARPKKMTKFWLRDPFFGGLLQKFGLYGSWNSAARVIGAAGKKVFLPAAIVWDSSLVVGSLALCDLLLRLDDAQPRRNPPPDGVPPNLPLVKPGLEFEAAMQDWLMKNAMGIPAGPCPVAPKDYGKKK
jgi:RHS repeat-associated protein